MGTRLREWRNSSIFTVALVALCGCGEQEEVAPELGRMVVTASVETSDAVERLELLGDIRGEVEVRVFAQVPERIRTLHVRDGETVSAGDPIVTLEADIAASDEAQAGAAVAASEAGRDRLSADVERMRGLVSQRAVASSQLESMEAQLRAAEAQVTQLRAGRRAAGARRARTVVRAPTDGIVALLTVEEGDMVAPSMPICSVVRMDHVKVRVQAVETDFVRLEEGMTVEVAPPALPDVRWVGTVTRVSPVIDRVTRTAAVEVQVDNPGHRLRPGMVAVVGIEIDRRAGVLMVPARAVVMTTRTDTDRTADVFVADGDVARKRSVTIGGRYGARIEIRSGLSAEDEVIVEGQHLLREGSPIRVRRPEPEVVDREAT